jgi:uncharacterized protein (DUF736 family)
MSTQQFDNTNRGAIFKNDRKEKDTHPDYRGKINVDGVDKEISLWVKTSKDGKQFFSASISAPYVKPDSDTPKPPPLSDEVDDDLPF